MPRKGKPSSPIWDLFETVMPKGEGKAHPDVSCPYCHKLFHSAQLAKHLRPHIRSCSFPADIKLLYAPSTPPTTPKKSSKRRSIGTPRSPSSTRKTPPKTLRVEYSQAELELDMAMAFYATGISFRVLEDPKMQRFFEHLRPDFKIPTRYKLAGPLLDKTYTREREKVIESLQNEPYVSIVTDGWANPNKQSIINFVITSPRMTPVFWSSIATGDKQHTGEYIADRIEEVIQEIEGVMKPGAVCSVVTDNASNMKSAWEILSAKRPNLTCNGCGAHMMNLIMKDVLDLAPVNDVLDNAKWISKYILSRYILVDHFDEHQKNLKSENRRRLCLPVPTRWYTSEACMKSVQQNKYVIQLILEDSSLDTMYKDKKRRAKLAKARELVADRVFWAKLDAVLLLLHPINNSLAEFENDGSFVSSVFDQFRRLSRNSVYHSELDNSVLQLNFLQREIRSFILSREDEFVTSSMKIGCLFDQRMDTSCFTDKELDETIATAAAMITADKEEQEVVSGQISGFVTDKLSWNEKTKKHYQTYTPLNWGSTRKTTYQLMRPLALRLFCIPTSSAASERSWSIHGFIHSKRRSRLTAARVEKLVFVYTNHNGEDYVMYDTYPEAPRESVRFERPGVGFLQSAIRVA